MTVAVDILDRMRARARSAPPTSRRRRDYLEVIAEIERLRAEVRPKPKPEKEKPHG